MAQYEIGEDNSICISFAISTMFKETSHRYFVRLLDVYDDGDFHFIFELRKLENDGLTLGTAVKMDITKSLLFQILEGVKYCPFKTTIADFGFTRTFDVPPAKAQYSSEALELLVGPSNSRAANIWAVIFADMVEKYVLLGGTFDTYELNNIIRVFDVRMEEGKRNWMDYMTVQNIVQEEYALITKKPPTICTKHEKSCNENQPEPCFVIISPIRGRSDIFFPRNRHSLQVEIQLGNYVIIGKPTPLIQRNWFLLYESTHRKVMFFDGRTEINLPDLPHIPTGKVLGCFWGNPDDSDCKVLILVFGDHEVTCIPYYLDMWAETISFEIPESQKPMGELTTESGFSWIDTKTGFLYIYEDLWNRFLDVDTFNNPTIATIEVDHIINADMICSLVHENQFHSMIVRKEGVFELYRLGELIRQGDICQMPIYSMASLLPGQGIYASPNGPGLLTTVPRDHSQKVYTSTWGDADVTRVTVDGGPLNPTIIRDCHYQVVDDDDDNDDLEGHCYCESYVVMLKEDDIF